MGPEAAFSVKEVCRSAPQRETWRHRGVAFSDARRHHGGVEFTFGQRAVVPRGGLSMTRPFTHGARGGFFSQGGLPVGATAGDVAPPRGCVFGRTPAPRRG